VTPYHSEAVLIAMQARFRELSALLARLNRGLAASASEPVNPGFEPEAAPPADTAMPLPPLPEPADPPQPTVGAGPSVAPALAGWHLEGPKEGEPGAARATAAAIAVDRENPHSGRGCLRLAAPAVSASVVSDPFVPNVQSHLTIQAFFRSEPAEARVRVWIEGEAGGQPYVRRSELTVPAGWTGLAVRASDLPPGGLDSARLRFEMMSPGVLWIDDLHIASDPAANPARLNAQRTLLAALQAYRERRYAEFARLSASHWVQPSGASAWARLAGASGPDAPQPGRGAARPGASAAASALPPDRKLR
jgi:hypothetical protein